MAEEPDGHYWTLHLIESLGQLLLSLQHTCAHWCAGINNSFLFLSVYYVPFFLQFLILSVDQVMSAWWTEMWHHCWLAGWRCAFLECGVRSVMMGGTKEMPRLYAGNWDQHHHVSGIGFSSCGPTSHIHQTCIGLICFPDEALALALYIKQSLNCSVTTEYSCTVCDQSTF